MRTVVYSCPFVPPEWIAAHGLRPRRIVPGPPESDVLPGTGMFAGMGVCPYARAFLHAAASATAGADIAVFTTVCDQMRRIAEFAESNVPTFLMHVPATWQTPQAHRLYGDELKRLGRFFEALGTPAPSASTLADVMLDYDARRRRLLDAMPLMSARAFSEAATNLHEYRPSATLTEGQRRSGVLAASLRSKHVSAGVSPASALAASLRAVRLALVGGPLPREDYALFELIEAAGGTVVLNATENGERTFPAPFDRRRVHEGPFGQLVDAYFGHIPDAFRRPNSALYSWLKHELEARDVQGIVLRRYVWCDTWHAEIQRMAEWAPVPLLALDVEDGFATNPRTRSRVDAFLEALR